ncbi:hypothetical protein [Noviherbaspirillum sp. UKPF54]|uniref:hypothetical protein n=1 Tax=Noviherbaspirillum sp. UKPF54 TaxID=2601898 RepID=UPI0011B18E8B|nr:hypothetical protein [Noviherbaspirillum sp. UKPF54]QDZ27657.1 hypothetical protein FAY22_06615 [Noviherbaspirillum sp. UKPF54]
MNSESTLVETELSPSPAAAEAINQDQRPAPLVEAMPTAQSSDLPEAAAPAIERPSQVDNDVNYVSLIFRDGLDMSIAGLELFVTLPSGHVCTATSTAQGAITLPVPAKASGHAQVEVKDSKGKRQPVCSIDLAQCNDAVIIRSPKVKADLPLRPHQQSLPPKPSPLTLAQPKAVKPPATQPGHVDTDSPWWNANGTVQQAWNWLTSSLHVDEQRPASTPTTPVISSTLSKAGQPVTVLVGPECPNKDRLRLGRNNIYRQAILDASKRLGLIPQALCALMDCEAGKVTEHIPKLGPNGEQLKDKNGKPLTTTIRELWNANAGNAQSGAAGLTQFLASTWLGHVLKPGLYIHDRSVANGWVRKEVDAKGRPRCVFVLANGKTTTDPYLKCRNDDNVKKCLAMRMDPTWSINAAADYGNANLKLLASQGFKLASLNDMDRAKLMYLMHHEGEGAGPLFIRNTLARGKGGIEGLRKKFATQLGKDGRALAQELIDRADGDVEIAYRNWLGHYIDMQFSAADKYFCSEPVSAKTLSKLMSYIGGEKL